jgi:hypothetical protein
VISQFFTILQNKCKTCVRRRKYVTPKKIYIEARKPSGIYYYIIRDPVSRKALVYRSTGTTDRKHAETIGMEWWTNGIKGKTQVGIDRKTIFCDYLYQFWDFDTSVYFRELETMGREPHPEHALEMQKIVERYYRPYFDSIPLLEAFDSKNFIRKRH